MTTRRWYAVVVVVALAVIAFVIGHCKRDPSGGATVPLVSGSGAQPVAGRARPAPDARPRPKPPSGGFRLEGQVIDEQDRPVAGATVRLHNFDGETLTTDDGSFVFEHLGADDYEVTAENGEDTYCETERVSLTESTEPVILKLMPAATAIVHVIDAVTKQPIAGARLGTRVTDANGDVRVRGLEPGTSHIYILGIEADGYENARAKLSSLDLANPEDNRFIVEMKPGHLVRGIVQGPSGERIENAWVSAAKAGDVQTDAAGAWSITLSPGPHELDASAKGFVDSPKLALDIDAPREGIVLRLPARSPDAPPEDPDDASTGSIAGIVVDTRGRPAPGVRVTVHMESATALTDAKGRFEIGALEPGNYRLFVAHVEQQYAQLDQGVVASTGDRDVRLTVTDVGTITGRVVLDGRPVPYYGVYLPDADQIYDHPIIVRSPDGRFAAKGLVAGTYSLVIAGPGFARKTVERVVVPENGDVDAGTIAVDRGRTVRGRVTDANGPVAGATVTIHDRDTPRDVLTRAVEGTGVATTDASGNYKITALAPQLWTSYPRRIVASHPTRGVSVERALGDASEVNLVIGKPGAIEGRLEGIDTGVFCARVDDLTFTYAASPDKGRFAFENLPPGAYRCRANTVAATVATTTVVGGQRAKVALVVPADKVQIVIAGACKTATLSTEDGLDELYDQQCGQPIGGVSPGSYRACAAQRCATIKVLPAPAVQTFTP